MSPYTVLKNNVIKSHWVFELVRLETQSMAISIIESAYSLVYYFTYSYIYIVFPKFWIFPNRISQEGYLF